MQSSVPVGFAAEVPSGLTVAMQDRNQSVVVSHTVKGQQKRVTEYWFDVVNRGGESVTYHSCIASVRPLESGGTSVVVESGATVPPVLFSSLLPTMCWGAAATAVANSSPITLHDIRTRLRRGQAAWDRSDSFKGMQNPFTVLLELSVDTLREGILSFICQPVPGMSSGRVSVKDPQQQAQLMFRLSMRFHPLILNDCLQCVFGLDTDSSAGVGSDSGVSGASTTATAAQGRKIAGALLKEVLRVGHPSMGHYIPSITPVLACRPQNGSPPIHEDTPLLHHANIDKLTQTVRWIHFDRLIRMLSDIVGTQQSQQLINEAIGVHGPSVEASNREQFVKGVTPDMPVAKLAEDDNDDDEAPAAPIPKAKVGEKRGRVFNEHGEEDFSDGEKEAAQSPRQQRKGTLVSSIRDLPFDIKTDWAPLLPTPLSASEYISSVDTAVKAAQTNNIPGSSVSPQAVFETTYKALSGLHVVSDIQRTCLEVSQILGVADFAPVEPGGDFAADLIVRNATPQVGHSGHRDPLAEMLSLSGTVSPISSSGSVKHSHRPSRLVHSAPRQHLSGTLFARCKELVQRLDTFSGLAKRRLELFEAVLQSIGTVMQSTASAASGETWTDAVVEGLPHHPLSLRAAIGSSTTATPTMHIRVASLSVETAQEILHWVQINHFVAVVMQSLLFHAEEWSTLSKIYIRETEELASMEAVH